MANPTALTVYSAVANGTAAATGDLWSPATSVGTGFTVSANVSGHVDRTLLIIHNDSTVATNKFSVSVAGCEAPPPFLGTAIAAVTAATFATAQGIIMGPFSHSRHNYAGTLRVTVTSAGTECSARIKTVLLPASVG